MLWSIVNCIKANITPFFFRFSFLFQISVSHFFLKLNDFKHRNTTVHHMRGTQMSPDTIRFVRVCSTGKTVTIWSSISVCNVVRTMELEDKEENKAGQRVKKMLLQTVIYTLGYKFVAYNYYYLIYFVFTNEVHVIW